MGCLSVRFAELETDNSVQYVYVCFHLSNIQSRLKLFLKVYLITFHNFFGLIRLRGTYMSVDITCVRNYNYIHDSNLQVKVSLA